LDNTRTFPVDLDICNATKSAKMLPDLCVWHVWRNIADVHIGVLGISLVHCRGLKAVCVLLVLCPTAPGAPAFTIGFVQMSFAGLSQCLSVCACMYDTDALLQHVCNWLRISTDAAGLHNSAVHVTQPHLIRLTLLYMCEA